MLGFGVDVVREALSCLYCGKVADQVVYVFVDFVYQSCKKTNWNARKVRDYVSDRNIGEDAASPEEMEKALQIMGFDTEDAANRWVKMGGFSMKCIFPAFKWLQTVWRMLRESKTVWEEPPPKVQLALFEYLILVTPLAQKRTDPINTYM